MLEFISLFINPSLNPKLFSHVHATPKSHFVGLLVGLMNGHAFLHFLALLRLTDE